MCGCEAHHDDLAPCSCGCPQHEGVRRAVAKWADEYDESGSEAGSDRPVAPYKAFRHSIVGCARCHGDGHENLWWEPLTHPVIAGSFTATRWAACPTNGQPILMSGFFG